MNATGLLAFALMHFIFVLSPGPGVAATVARGLGSGMKKSLGFALGFMLGDMIWFTVAATGLATIATHFELAFTVFKYLGCAYLLYMALKIWTAPVVATDVAVAGGPPGEWAGFVGTLTLTLSNPKAIVYFLSLMPLVVDLQNLTMAAYVAMMAVSAFVGGGSVLMVLYLATQARRVFSSTKALQRINRTSAAMMVGAVLAIGMRN